MRLASIIFISTLTLFTHSLTASTFQGHDVVDKTIILKFRASSSLKFSSGTLYTKDLTLLLKSIGASKMEKMFPRSTPPTCENCVDISKIYRFTYTKNISVEKVIYYLGNLPEIEYCQPEFIHELCYTPNDPQLSKQYHLDIISAYKAWDSIKSDTTIIIGITDTGVDIDHEDLINQIAYNYNDPINGVDDDNDGYIDNFRGWDLAENDNNPDIDKSDHGTWVAGMAVAEPNNGIGIAGSSYGAKFLPIKTASAGGSLQKTWESIVYAADHGCSIINCSWGGTYKEPLGEDIVNYATFNRNALIVAAAGNNSTQQEFYPASYKNCLSVGGTVANDQKWSVDNSQSSKGSSWGYNIDISAPAASYHSTSNGSTYSFIYGGTSFAAPIVSGAAAIIKTAYPDLSPLAIAEQLKAYAFNIDSIPYNKGYKDMLGTGRLDIFSSATRFDKPGISSIDQRITTEAPFMPGDTVAIEFDLKNHLASTDSLWVKFEFNTKLISIIQDSIFVGRMSQDEIIANDKAVEFKFILSKSLPFDFEAYGKLVFRTSGYRSYEYVQIQANPSSLDIHDRIETTITANGRIGYDKLDQNGGIGLTYEAYSNLLFDGGLIVAEASNKVASSFLGKQDFLTIAPVHRLENDTVDYHFQSQYRADFLEINVTQNTYFWSDSNYMLIEYTLYNDSQMDKPNIIAGNYWDWEISNQWYNRIRFSETDSIAFAQTTEPDPLYIASAILDNDFGNIYAVDNTAGGDGIIDLYYDDSDYARYYCLTHNRLNSKETLLGNDIALFMSAKPKNLSAGDSTVFRTAIIFGKNQDDIRVLKSKLNYNIVERTNRQEKTKSIVQIYPTITSDWFTIETEENAKLEFYSTTGKICLQHTVSGGKNSIDISKLTSGVYTLEIKTQTKSVVKTIIKK